MCVNYLWIFAYISKPTIDIFCKFEPMLRIELYFAKVFLISIQMSEIYWLILFLNYFF